MSTKEKWEVAFSKPQNNNDYTFRNGFKLGYLACDAEVKAEPSYAVMMEDGNVMMFFEDGSLAMAPLKGDEKA